MNVARSIPSMFAHFCVMLRTPIMAFGLASLVLASHFARADDAVVKVQLDQARIINMPKDAKTLVVGNPLIADVTLLKGSGTMVVTGKSYGLTNLIALDGAGKPIGESMIQVEATLAGKVLVQRGMEQDTYYCNPRCQPTVFLGDDPAYVGMISGQIKDRNSASDPNSSPAASTQQAR